MNAACRLQYKLSLIAIQEIINDHSYRDLRMEETMELRQLKTFRVVATLNSFNQAAEVLGYAQSTVSQHIKSLEEDLATSLFIRAGRHIALTEAGELLLQYAHKILDVEEEIRTKIIDQSETFGSLAMRIPETVSTYYLPLILSGFHKLYPKVGFSFNRCSYFGLEDELRSGMIDLAFLMTDAYRTSSLEVEMLTQLKLVMVAHPGNSLTSKPGVSARDIGDEPLFLPKEDCSYGKLLKQVLTEETTEPKYVLSLNSIEAIKKCIIEGIGITIIPELAVQEEINSGSMSILPWRGEGLDKVKLFMIWHKDRWVSPVLQAFMQVTREVVSPSPGAHPS